MNQKIEIFSFIALPSPNTKKNHPKWDLGKDFSSQAFKGQMNQKIEIFSFAALSSSNTKKNHPKWDLGKDFSSQAFIER